MEQLCIHIHWCYVLRYSFQFHLPSRALYYILVQLFVTLSDSTVQLYLNMYGQQHTGFYTTNFQPINRRWHCVEFKCLLIRSGDYRWTILEEIIMNSIPTRRMSLLRTFYSNSSNCRSGTTLRRHRLLRPICRCAAVATKNRNYVCGECRDCRRVPNLTRCHLFLLTQICGRRPKYTIHQSLLLLPIGQSNCVHYFYRAVTAASEWGRCGGRASTWSEVSTHKLFMIGQYLSGSDRDIVVM